MSPKQLSLLALLMLAASPAAAEPAGEAAGPASPEAGQEAADLGPDANWNALNWDISRLAPAKGFVGGAPVSAPLADWSRIDKKDGSAAVTVKRALPTDWDSKVGLDLNLAGSQGMPPATDPLSTSRQDSTGAAWATITAPALNLPAGWDKATIDARVDPSADQRRIGTALTKSVPLNDNLSLTLKNGYAVTHQGPGAASPESAAAPVTAPTPADIYSADTSAKLNLLPTGTAIAVEAARSTTDDKWLRTLRTEQKLFGGINVTGAISETPEGLPSRSIGAGFKKNW